MEQLGDTLRRMLAARFGIRKNLDLHTPLFSGGLIDSLSVIEMVSMFEEKSGLQVDPTEITLDNFDSVDRMVRFASSRSKAFVP